MPRQLVTVAWSDGYSKDLLIEDRVEDPGEVWWSATEQGHDNGSVFYKVHDDGCVTDDAGNGDWFGVVTDWQGLKTQGKG